MLRAGQPLRELGTSKGQALLFYLVLEAAQIHRREHLAELFWPDRTSQAAFNNLNQTLFTLRRAIGDPTNALPLLLSDRHTVQINPAVTVETDARSFAQLAAAGLADPGHGLSQLTAAINLYHGPFLHGLSLRDAWSFEEWLLVQRERLHLQAIAVLHVLFSSSAHAGDHTGVLAHGRHLLQLDPWHEPAHRAVMTALAAHGQRSAALRQFELCRSILANELGVEPEAETLAVARAIRAEPTVRRRPQVVGLPRPACERSVDPLRPLLGRKRELATLHHFWQAPQAPWLTVTGPAGVGKSHLVRHALQRLDAAQPAALVLSVSPNPDALPLASQLGRALGLEPSQTCPETLVAALRTRYPLLVLDGLERLTEADRLLLATLVTSQGLPVVATARRPLGLPGEQVLALTGLVWQPTQPSAAAGDAPAVALFMGQLERMGRALPPTELGLVVQICQRLDGMPRALVLAATLAGHSSCQQVLAELA